MQKTILLTGGAGYIGSHTAYLLASQGYRVIILDKLLHKQPFAHPWAKLIESDFADVSVLQSLFKEYAIDAVMHFAAFIEVGRSTQYPQEFYENNVTKTLQLLDVMRSFGVKKCIFSSSCALYGNPVVLPMTEDHPRNPISPYGKNKCMVEFALEDYYHAYGLQYVSLRYFNASGAFPQAGLGEFHMPETHLIPLLLRAIRQQQPFTVFGDDYDTKDGTCVRDYIHVRDIAEAHVLGLHHLEQTKTSDVFNLGTGTGHSVRDVITVAEHVCDMPAKIIIASRRDGDVATLVADPTKAMSLLSWKPQYSDLNFILKSALHWEAARELAMQEHNAS